MLLDCLGHRARRPTVADRIGGGHRRGATDRTHGVPNRVDDQVVLGRDHPAAARRRRSPSRRAARRLRTRARRRPLADRGRSPGHDPRPALHVERPRHRRPVGRPPSRPHRRRVRPHHRRWSGLRPAHRRLPRVLELRICAARPGHPPSDRRPPPRTRHDATARSARHDPDHLGPARPRRLGATDAVRRRRVGGGTADASRRPDRTDGRHLDDRRRPGPLVGVARRRVPGARRRRRRSPRPGVAPGDADAAAIRRPTHASRGAFPLVLRLRLTHPGRTRARHPRRCR